VIGYALTTVPAGNAPAGITIDDVAVGAPVPVLNFKATVVVALFAATPETGVPRSKIDIPFGGGATVSVGAPVCVGAGGRNVTDAVEDALK
jgi:hypothetical protein